MTYRISPRFRPLLAAGFALVAAIPLSGCQEITQMQFTRDDSLRITAPENLSTVDLPLNVSWDVESLPEGADRVAVFVDRYPMPPGSDLRSIVDQDANCRGTDQCLEESFLARIYGIYVTDATGVTIQSMPVRGNTGTGSHFVTIVPIDDTGQRSGESVWFVSFQVEA